MMRPHLDPMALFALVCVMMPAPTLAQANTRIPPAQQSAPAEPDLVNLINADRPGIADGSRVIAKGQIQTEFGFQREYRDESAISSRTSFLPSLVRVGLFNRCEARIETNAYTWITTVSPFESSALGWSPASIGFKYQLTDPAATDRPSLGAIVRIFPASGSADFGTDRVTEDVRLAADIDLSPTVSLNPNVGITRSEGSGGRVFTAALAAVTLTYVPTAHVNLFIDLGYQSAIDRGGASSLIVDGGLGYIVGRNTQIDLSLGAGAHGPAPRPFVSFGISRRWRG